MDPTTTLRRTPLHAEHLALGAKMAPFGGWDMPIQYAGPQGGILNEHRAVRSAAGVFDTSHMGEFWVDGPGAVAFLSRVVPGDVANLPVGKALYTQFTRPDGGVIDDLIIYYIPAAGGQEAAYQLVVNAGNLDRDLAWLRSQLPPSGVNLTDRSEATAMLALQGPRAQTLLAALTDLDLPAIPFFGVAVGPVAGVPAFVARTGYTGEDGFEIFVEAHRAAELWKALLATGAVPAGLGARDTLRLEAGLPLYGHELTEEVTPVEASLGWTVKSTADFLGADVIRAQKSGERPLSRKLVGLAVEGRAPAREGYPILADGREVGRLVSGTLSPTLGRPIATGFVPPEFAKPGTRLAVKIRDQEASAEVVKLPFYRRPTPG